MTNETEIVGKAEELSVRLVYIQSNDWRIPGCRGNGSENLRNAVACHIHSSGNF